MCDKLLYILPVIFLLYITKLCFIIIALLKRQINNSFIHSFIHSFPSYPQGGLTKVKAQKYFYSLRVPLMDVPTLIEIFTLYFNVLFHSVGIEHFTIFEANLFSGKHLVN